MVVLDTNVLIDHLRTSEGITELITAEKYSSLKNIRLAISVLTVQELYTGRSAGLASVVKTINSFLEYFIVLPYEINTAKLAGYLSREELCRGPFDCGIAATCLQNKCSLLTLNKKDFSKVPRLVLL